MAQQLRSRADVPKEYHKYLKAVWVQRSVEEGGKKGMVVCMDYTLLEPGFQLHQDERAKVCIVGVGVWST